MGDFNLDMKSKSLGYDKLDEFCDLFNLTNLIKSETCFTKNHKSLIDLFLTNTPWSFQKTHVSETGLSDYHKLITTFFKTNISRLRPKVLSYRIYKNFIESKFLNDLNKTIISFDNENPNQNYNVLSNRLLEVVNVHAPLKTKIVRGNDAPFVDKQFRKAIYTRTRLKNKIHRNPSKENKMAYKKQRNFCVSLRRKCMKNYLKKLTEKGLKTNKSFWKFMKPFLTNKGLTGNNDITLIHQNKIISDEKQLSKLFNSYYINIVEKSSDTKTFGINFKNTSVQSVRDIVNSYKNHPSILKIKQVVNGSNVSDSERFSFKTINESEIKDLLKNLDIKKASGIDTIPPKLVKLSADFLTPLLTKAINTSIAQNVFPENAKTASVIPLDEGKPNKNEMSNFRPVSVLNTFSKIYEKVIKDQIVRGMEKYFLPFLSAYRKNYSLQNILISLTEEWRKKLDNNFVVGAVLTDLPKAFDCIPHDLIIAKLSAYNFSDEALFYIYSYLTNRRQCVRINNTHSQLETIISGVPQGSILGPILFNLSINGLFFFVVLASLYNFADDNTLSAFATTVSELIKILESESEFVIDWFKINKMVVNPDTFQAIILDKRKRDHTDEHITVDNQQVKVVSSMKLLGLQLDDTLNFNLHISNICKSAANQLNALIKLKKFMNFEEKKILINSYFMANFNYCPLVWMLSNASSLKKIENLQKRALRFLCNDYEISYEELLSKSSTSSMNVKRLRALCVELYKTINKLNPDFMRDLFKLRFTNRPVREKYKMNMIILEFNQVSYGKKSLRTFDLKL